MPPTTGSTPATVGRVDAERRAEAAPTANAARTEAEAVAHAGRYQLPARLVEGLDHYPVSITALSYAPLSAEAIHRLSYLPCRRVINSSQRSFGVNDTRLGVCDRATVCATCGASSYDCTGHLGHVDLEAPVFHVGYFTVTLRILRTICKHCAHVLLTREEKELYRRRLRRSAFGALSLEPPQQQALVKQIQEDAYKTRVCLHCGAVNGVVRRLRPMRLIHEKYRRGLRRNEDVVEDAVDEFKGQLQAAMAHNSDVEANVDHAQECLDPARVRALFAAIPPEEYILLGMPGGPESRMVNGPDGASASLAVRGATPLDLLVTTLAVAPVCVRPRGLSAMGGAGAGGGAQVREDDLTPLYNEVITSSDSLRDGANDVAKYVENWENLQARVVRLHDSAMPGYPAHQRAADVKAFAQRLKGKHGRFRGNLSGKRVDFSGRSVISPDPNLGIDELAVPLHVARVLTYPQRVFAHNLELMRRLVRNGPNVHPGASTVFLAKENSRRTLQYARDREVLAARLSIGDMVERHVMNGDMVLFNRQPSLHRISMMAHRARVLPYKTFRFNECCCAPYNADFDGDEMNVHLVQTEEARAEAEQLMLTANNIITAKNGEPIIACTQDFLTAAYLITSRDAFFDRAQFTMMVSYWLGPTTHYELPIPALLRPAERWTGKQLMELILRPSAETDVLLSLEAKARFYTGHSGFGSEGRAKHDDLAEGFVAFLDSHYISGRLDKKLLGGGAKDGLFARLYALSGGAYTARVMSRIAQFTSRYLQNYGFSLGLGDVAPTPSLNERKATVLARSFAKCEALIHEASTGRLVPVPGMTVKQSLEARLNAELSQVRDDCGTAAVDTLDPRFSAPLIMVNAGSKGSALNTAQMMACVGQQTVSGKRIVNAFQDRSLPHFSRYAETPAARGFVANSFYSGLTPVEFFFHTMAGREGLVDTAVKTAETGYIYRRLSKAMENLSVQYDGSVRVPHPQHGSTVIQMRYGEDGMDPWLMEGANGTPLNLQQQWLAARAAYARATHAREQRARRLQELQLLLHTNRLRHLKKPSKRSVDDLQAALDAAGASTPAHGQSGNTVDAAWYLRSLLPDEVIPFVQALLSGTASAVDACQRQREAEHAQAAAAERVERALSTAVDANGAAHEEAERVMAAAVKPHATAALAAAHDDPASASALPAAEVAATLRHFAAQCSQRFRNDVVAFFDRLVEDQRRLRALLELPAERDNEEMRGASDCMESLQTELLPLTRGMISLFLGECARLYRRKACEPGTPCGAIAAQSVGEPSTQMTLRTFHFAGVASMSITQGVPRLVEIINANKNIATPVITAPIVVAEPGFTHSVLANQPSAAAAAAVSPQQALRHTSRAVKALMERVVLKEVTTEIVEVLRADEYCIQIFLNMELIENLLLPIDAAVVRLRILEAAARPMSRLRLLKESCLRIVSRNSLLVYPFEQDPKKVHFNVQFLLSVLPDLVVGGVPGVSRVMVAKDGAQLLAEGAELRAVMALPHVDGTRASCNHVAVVERTLGIEAARQVIINEINSILKAYSLSIDARHVFLLADVMTNRGTVLGITRYGIQKMNNSVLTMASFERTTEHLYNAAALQRADTKLSVSESIIVGKPIPLGTSSFSLLLDQGADAAQGVAPAPPAAAAAATSLQEAFLEKAYERYSMSGRGGLAGAARATRLGLGGARAHLPLAAEGAFHVDLFS